MNKAVFIFTLWLKLSQISKFDYVVFITTFLGLLAAAFNKIDFNEVLGACTNPATLLILGYGFARDSALNTISQSDGEYFALLFSRPITRSSYVITKAIVTAIGILILDGCLILQMIVAQLLAGCQPLVFPDLYRALSLVASAFGFGCLMVFMRALPPKISNITFALFVYVCAGSSLPLLDCGVKINEANFLLNSTVINIWEVLCNTTQQFFYPALEIDVLINTAPFSLVPVVAYVSNCLIYLLGATVLLNRREFSYAEN